LRRGELCLPAGGRNNSNAPSVTTDVGTEPERKRSAVLGVGVHADLYVVREGVRHIAIDVLPREPLTFRAACGLDVAPEENAPADTAECMWCLRFERTWLLVKATDVI
jgi:hypothetical protein